MIFHLPFEPDKNRYSASHLRPFLMLKAFQEIGYKVDVVMGKAIYRKKQMASIKQAIIDGEKYAFVYSESSTMPTLLTEVHHAPTFPFLDFGFFRFLKNHQVPIGLFYRDIHWKFEHYQVQPLKKWISKIFYRYDLKEYKKWVDVLFLPSLEMGNYLPELHQVPKIALPPGCESSKIIAKRPIIKNSPLKILYVGGLGDLYQLELMLDTVLTFSLNQMLITICTREDDLNAVRHKYIKYFNRPQIIWVHKGGEELKEIYDAHDICCLWVNPSRYWEFAMPVKLFEYLAFQKPILAVSYTAAGNFVTANKIGWATAYDQGSLRKILLRLLDETWDEMPEYLSQVAHENTWEKRALEVENNLIK